MRTVAITLLLASAAGAQTPQFEVASIRKNASGVARSLGGPARGHFVQSGTLKQLIQMAYRRGGYEVRTVSGGPKWIDVDHAEPPTPD